MTKTKAVLKLFTLPYKSTWDRYDCLVEVYETFTNKELNDDSTKYKQDYPSPLTTNL